jgi:hypothetical protein
VSERDTRDRPAGDGRRLTKPLRREGRGVRLAGRLSAKL